MYVFLYPNIPAAMARDARGTYRLSRQRRPFLSGTEGSAFVGAGVTRVGASYLLRDVLCTVSESDAQELAKETAPSVVPFPSEKESGRLKSLKPLYASESQSHERIVIACTRCQTANEVSVGDFIAYLERTFAPH